MDEYIRIREGAYFISPFIRHYGPAVPILPMQPSQKLKDRVARVLRDRDPNSPKGK